MAAYAMEWILGTVFVSALTAAILTWVRSLSAP
jgi:hypothetical protein